MEKTGEGLVSSVYIINANTHRKVKMVKSQPDGSYSILLPPGEDYDVTAANKRYTIASKSIKSNTTESNDQITIDFQLFPPATADIEGHTFTLRNIYFDYDKTSLDFGAFGLQSQIELDLLGEFMLEYPSLKIELAGHTDQRGGAEYNLELSEKRAQISKQYLVALGIDPSRIKAIGYGENKTRGKRGRN